MFVGHFGLAFGAKKAAPAVSLGALFAACQFADLLWPTLVLLGYERVEIQPGATSVDAAEFRQLPVLAQPAGAVRLGRRCSAAIYVAIRRDAGRRRRHHRAARRQPLAARLRDPSPRYAADARRLRRASGSDSGIRSRHTGGRSSRCSPSDRRCICARRRRAIASARSACGRSSASWWSCIWPSAFGPPPPTAAAVAWSAQAMWLLVIWAYWVDNHRRRDEMGKKDPRVDAYIRKAAPFAQPILTACATRCTRPVPTSRRR